MKAEELIAIGLWIFFYSLASPAVRRKARKDLAKRIKDEKPKALKQEDAEVIG